MFQTAFCASSTLTNTAPGFLPASCQIRFLHFRTIPQFLQETFLPNGDATNTATSRTYNTVHLLRGAITFN